MKVRVARQCDGISQATIAFRNPKFKI